MSESGITIIALIAILSFFVYIGIGFGISDKLGLWDERKVTAMTVFWPLYVARKLPRWPMKFFGWLKFALHFVLTVKN